MSNTYQVINGDCLEKMAALPSNSVDLILTDPPYFKVKDDDWDRQWEVASEFIEWLDKIAAEWERVLKPNGSLYCFASPQMAARVEIMISKRFRVLNHIVWRKPSGTFNRHCLESLRAYATATERIIFAEKKGAENMAKSEGKYRAKCDELRTLVFEPLRSYLIQQRELAGLTSRKVCEALGCETPSHYFSKSQWALPTKEHYQKMREIFNSCGRQLLVREFEDLRNEYELLWSKFVHMRNDFEHLKRPFDVAKPCEFFTEIWTFQIVQHYKGKHPCEKPQELLAHIIKASSRPGALVLDSFAGTGSTGVACKRLGRSFIGIELSPEYAATIEARLSDSLALPVADPA